MISLSGRGQGNLDVEIYNRFFKDVKDGVCLECGALDGITLSVGRFFEVNLNWKCINVEASPMSFKLLEANRPKSINLNFALGDKVETLSFLENKNKPKNGYLMNDDGVKTHPKINLNGLPQVKCLTYKSLVDDILIPKYGIDHIDLFVLDVEGCEVRVSEGMKGAKIMPSVLCSEISWYKKEIVEKIEKNLPEYKFVFNMGYNYVFLKQNDGS